MHIQRIRLRDWKAFVDTTVDFPAATKKRNVVLIGAMNGYGKTTLLEALVLGLFGRDASASSLARSFGTARSSVCRNPTMTSSSVPSTQRRSSKAVHRHPWRLSFVTVLRA
ncbi:MAG: AAA family ATPase [Myxococcales bacterium]|nr:AAA family ATPase [Myxococcales bacterium]